MKYTIVIDDGVDLKKELKRLNITLRKFSEISGVHFATLSSIANGARCSEERATLIKNALVLPKNSYK